MPLLKKCCFCFSLKTGGVILGWLGAVSAALASVIALIALCNVDSLTKMIMENLEKQGPNSIAKYDEDFIKTALQIGLGFYLAMALIGLISASLLIAGSVKRNRFLLLPWLISFAVSLGIGGLMILAQIVGCFSHDVSAGFLALFVGGGMYAFELYLWFAIFSLFQQLREEETSGLGATALIYKSPPADGLPAYKGMA
ncbi:hypothetical protein DMENIID0001_160480 [Sergentomyia squamirostris]